MKKSKRKDFIPLSKTHPHLAAEWSKDNVLSPQEISRGSRRIIIWECSNKHKWEESIFKRAFHGKDCEECKNILKPNQKLNYLHSDLSLYWSNSNKLSFDDVGLWPSKYFLWRCSKNHDFRRSIRAMINGSRNCPYCSGREVLSGFNDLFTTHPKLVNMWSDKNELDPKNITYGSNKKAIWICSRKHEFLSSVKRVTSGVGCPYCAGQKVLFGFNDLTTTHPVLAKQWHSINVLKPEEVSKGYRTGVWWVCPKGHEFKRTPAGRSSSGGCYNCSSSISRREKELLSFVQSLCSNVIGNDRKVLNGKEIDILLPDIKKGIEFDGRYWHSDEFLLNTTGFTNEYHRNKKRALAKNKGFELIFIDEQDWIDNQVLVKKIIIDFIK